MVICHPHQENIKLPECNFSGSSSWNWDLGRVDVKKRNLVDPSSRGIDARITTGRAVCKDH